MSNEVKLSIEDSAVGVIYAGGEGKRLWPVSTKKSPKQVNPTFSKETLVVDTFKRAKKIFPTKKIILVITKSLYRKISRLIKLPKDNYLVQPENADTAAAMGLAAMHIEAKFQGATAVTLYSDHLISSVSAYKATIKKGINIVQKQPVLLTIGTKPTYPSPDFGYIKLGQKMDLKNLYKVSRFVEKPSKEKAAKMIAAKKYVWNTGVYIWRAETLLRIFKNTALDIYKGLVDLRTKINDKSYEAGLEQWYDKVRRESFDRAISEETKKLLVLVSDYNWKDVGNWKTVYNLAKKDKNGHALIEGENSRIISINAGNCLIIPKQKVISLIGVQDLIVVQTKNELLICDINQSHKVKKAAKIIEG